MGRYKTTHSIEHGPFPGTTAKKATITDTETGEKASAEVWDHESYEKAEDKAFERLKDDE